MQYLESKSSINPCYRSSLVNDGVVKLDYTLFPCRWGVLEEEGMPTCFFPHTDLCTVPDHDLAPLATTCPPCHIPICPCPMRPVRLRAFMLGCHAAGFPSSESQSPSFPILRAPLAEAGCPMSRVQEHRTNRERLYRPLPAARMA
jgi:hypothetical protein